MKWVATNIRFPEDMYMELKMEAARKRKSVAQVVRNKITKKKKAKKKTVEKQMKELAELAKENAKYLKGVDLTQALREIRYEQ